MNLKRVLAEREAAFLKEKERWSAEQAEKDADFRAEKDEWNKSHSENDSELSKKGEEISQLKSKLKGFEVQKVLDLKTQLQAKEEEIRELRAA